MNEAIETIELDDTEPTEEAKTTKEVTVLEAWYELLSNVAPAAKEPIRMAMVIPVLGRFPYLDVAEADTHFKCFYEILENAHQALMFEIASDPECLKNGVNDAEDNHGHYLNVIISWSKVLREYEDGWDVKDLDAAPKLTAGIAATEYLIGEQGLLAHLGTIGFNYNEGDFEMVAAAVEGGEVS